jgi:hypothetical protein
MAFARFGCIWETSTIETDEAGEDYSLHTVSAYTMHWSLHDAKLSAASWCPAATMEPALTIGAIAEEDTHASFCHSILEYTEKGELAGKHVLTDFDGWRFYARLPHWDTYYQEILQYPPPMPKQCFQK